MDAQLTEAPWSSLPKMVYIAGPMTGKPGFNFEAFFDAEARLLAAGYDVMNPARNDGGTDAKDALERAEKLNRSRKSYMWEDLGALLECDHIFKLPGWGKSRGARLESLVARETGITEVKL